MKSTFSNLDFWGTTTSLLCAIHCAVLPLMLSLGVVGSHSIFASPVLEGTVILLTCVFVYFSLVQPFLKAGHHKLSFFMALSGLTLILIHHFLDNHAVTAVTVGGLLVAAAHFYKLRSPSHNH